MSRARRREDDPFNPATRPALFATFLTTWSATDPAAPASGDALPYFVLGGYLLMLLVLGYFGYRRSVAGEEDYYLAGRRQGWIVSSLTIMATFFSSAAMLGVPGNVYKEGVVFALFALNVPLSGAAVYVLGGRIRRIGRARGYVTPADMIADYYDSPVALRLLVALIGFLYAVPYVVMQIRAGGFLSQQMFPGEYSYEIGACVLATITMLYIMIGGMRSVAWTDVIQGSLLIGGMLLGGAAVVWALGGVGGFFRSVERLPRASLSVPGTTESWPALKLFTVCVFASLGSMIQPAQWMRYYAARSGATLRRSALIFAVVLTTCYFFGVMLVGLGGQALHPLTDDDGRYRVQTTIQDDSGETQTAEARVPYDELDLSRQKLLPNEKVGARPDEFDQIMLVVLSEHVPQMFAVIGPLIAALVLIAIIGAAMSTADSNLHALSAVLTRDVYDRFIDPRASERRRAWVGRAVIAGATVLALAFVIVGRHVKEFDPVAMIIPLSFLAIAFSTQLLPVTVDMLFIRRGSRVGAAAGVIVGIAIVFMFSPFVSVLTQPLAIDGAIAQMKKMMDIGAWGLVGNVSVFALVSLVTARPNPQRVAAFDGGDGEGGGDA